MYGTLSIIFSIELVRFPCKQASRGLAGRVNTAAWPHKFPFTNWLVCCLQTQPLPTDRFGMEHTLASLLRSVPHRVADTFHLQPCRQTAIWNSGYTFLSLNILSLWSSEIQIKGLIFSWLVVLSYIYILLRLAIP